MKIAMIGAGSVVFARNLILDILSFPALRDCTISLMDIDPDRLDLITQLAEKNVADNNLSTVIESTTDREECLEDADYVIVMIQVGGLDAYKLDLEIPLKYGVDQCVGDTLGPGGVFRGLRSIPVMIDICSDMEELCPDALLLNYSNPMAINCWAMFTATDIDMVGLCHGVPGTAGEMARMIGAKPEECTYWTAGINHMAWFLDFRWKGEDAYPLLWQNRTPLGVPEAEEKYRLDMLKSYGYFMTESSGHLSEYIPYYRKRKDLRDLFNNPDFGGESLFYYRMCCEQRDKHYEEIRQQIAGQKDIPFGRHSGEYASSIIHALETNEYFRFNGNVENTGLITNLRDGCCAEVPCFVDSLGIHPCYVGDLPPHCAALCESNVRVQEMAVEAGILGDRDMAFSAVLADPLTAAVCAPHEVRKMVDEMLEAQKEWLPQFEME